LLQLVVQVDAQAHSLIFHRVKTINHVYSKLTIIVKSVHVYIGFTNLVK